MPAQYFDAKLSQIDKWIAKGIISYGKDGWVEIRSADLLKDVRDEPELFDHIANDFEQLHECLTQNLYDYFRMRDWKKQLREQSQHDKVSALENSGKMLSDSDIALGIERCNRVLDKFEADKDALYDAAAEGEARMKRKESSLVKQAA